MGLLLGNPVLAKEVRSRLRARRQSRGARAAAVFTIGVVLLLFYYYGLGGILEGGTGSAQGVYSFLFNGLLLTMILFLVPPLAAGAITQEREQQTWNTLLLTRLTAGEIVVGKFVASLLPVLLLLLLVAPLILLAAIAGELSLRVFLLSNLLLLATLAFIAAVSLFCSWALRRTFTATSAAYGVVAFLVVGTYLLYGLWEIGRINAQQPGREEHFVLLWLNPYHAMGYLLAHEARRDLGIGLVYIAFCVLGTLALLFTMTRRLARGPKELEQ